MEKSLFDFRDYKTFLSQALATTGEKRGARSRLAQFLNCQTAYISQVLNGTVHFSLEHAVQISEFLGHTSEEAHFFILLVHLGRAGSKNLRAYYENQILQIATQREQIRERIHVRDTLSNEDRAIYYSSWHVAAIHVMLSISAFQTPRAIAQHLGLSHEIVEKHLKFLESIGLALREGERFRIGNARIHLAAESPWISKHHANWRMRSLQSLDLPSKNDLHYSSVITLSESDVAKIREILLAALEKAEPIVRKSAEETTYSLCLDFFKI
ncbi:DUF4423 domain-containing protein [Bdellovibrionota bacterium FG-1]